MYNIELCLQPEHREGYTYIPSVLIEFQESQTGELSCELTNDFTEIDTPPSSENYLNSGHVTR